MSKKLPKKKGNWHKAVTIGASVLVASGALWFLTTASGSKIPVPSYQAMRVVDGDTFETNERQLIRLSGVDVPELKNCGGPEAKKALEKLISGKNLYVKVIYRDGSNRLISHVYNDQGFVSAQMARLGNAYYLGSGASDSTLTAASDYAREHKLGIFSSKCTQVTNTKQPDCVIKANNRDYSKPGAPKLYHFPGCGQYDHTQVELYKGDQWFCTESQAQKAGYSKGSDCFAKKWR